MTRARLTRPSMTRARLAVVLGLVSMVAGAGWLIAREVRASAVDVERDLVYADRDGVKVTLDVWRTAPAGEARPVVMLVHGGGWWLSDKREWEDVGWPKSLAREGFLVVSVNYRLACGLPVPSVGAIDPRPTARSQEQPLCGYRMDAQLDDISQALVWTRKHAKARGGDPSRIFMVGASAGAHLAAVTASDPDRTAPVRGVAGVSGPWSLPWFAEAGEPGEVLRPAVTRAVGCAYETCPERWRDMSPAATITRDQTPPTWLLAASGDATVPATVSADYRDALEDAGVEVRLAKVDHQCHGVETCGASRVEDSGELVLDDMVDWLRAEAEAE